MEEIEGEIWRDISGTDGFYQVSNMGRARTYNRQGCAARGQAKQKRAVPHLLSPNINDRGYLSIWVQRLKRLRKIHQLVLETFVGPCPPGCESSHLNGICTDNRLCNLVWEPHVKNMDRQNEHGTMRRGEQVNRAKLTEADVVEIKNRIVAGERRLEIAKKFGVTPGSIINIAAGKTWKHIEHPQNHETDEVKRKRKAMLCSKVMKHRWEKQKGGESSCG